MEKAGNIKSAFENSELAHITLEQMDLAGLLPIRVDH